MENEIYLRNWLKAVERALNQKAKDFRLKMDEANYDDWDWVKDSIIDLREIDHLLMVRKTLRAVLLEA